MQQKYPEEIKRLNRYKQAKAEYLAELKNLEELQTILYSATIPTNAVKVKKTVIQDKFSGKMDKLSAIQNRCSEKSQKAMSEMLEVLRLIDIVKTPIFKEILTKRYIHCLRWEQIAADLNYDYSHVSRLHNKAIEEIKKNEGQKRIL